MDAIREALTQEIAGLRGCSGCTTPGNHAGINWRTDMNNRAYYQREFACAGSALRAPNKYNPRNLPCPTCGEPDRLTPKDVRLGYQCDACADREEGGY